MTLFEKEKALGGVVRRVIPEFRIASEAIDRDVELVSAMGVRMVTGTGNYGRGGSAGSV